MAHDIKEGTMTQTLEVTQANKEFKEVKLTDIAEGQFFKLANHLIIKLPFDSESMLIRQFDAYCYHLDLHKIILVPLHTLVNVCDNVTISYKLARA